MESIRVYNSKYDIKYSITVTEDGIEITRDDLLNPTSLLLTEVQSIESSGSRLIINYFDEVDDGIAEASLSYFVKLSAEELISLGSDEVKDHVNDKTTEYAKRIAEEFGCPFYNR